MSAAYPAFLYPDLYGTVQLAFSAAAAVVIIYLDFSAQLTGGCLHKIVDSSGTGKFEGVDGKLRFFDVIPDPGESGASNFLYAGYLTYSG